MFPKRIVEEMLLSQISTSRKANGQLITQLPCRTIPRCYEVLVSHIERYGIPSMIPARKKFVRLIRGLGEGDDEFDAVEFI